MVVPHHERDDEVNRSDGHEELFAVMSGHAVFTVGGEEVDGRDDAARGRFRTGERHRLLRVPGRLLARAWEKLTESSRGSSWRRRSPRRRCR
jgi:hypothetical protein